MSQRPETGPPKDFSQQFLHIKAIDVSFNGRRPSYPLSVKIQIGNDSPLKSIRFGRDDTIHWEFENYLHPPVPADLTILVQAAHKFRCKKVYAVFRVAIADATEKDEYPVEDGNGKALVKLTCVRALPNSEFTKLLIKEAQDQVGKKKVLLDSLGKFSGFVAGCMKLAEAASQVNPYVGIAVSVINAFYEGCKSQQEYHEAAVDIMQELASFLPFTEDVPLRDKKDGVTGKVIQEMLELFCEISGSVIKYSNKNFLEEMLSSSVQEKIKSSKDDFAKLKAKYDWCIKVETWKAVIEIEEQVGDAALRTLHPASQAYYDIDKRCLEGTRVAVLKRVEEWARSESEIFWLHGVAGSGKSAIANSVAHMFRQEMRLSGCFFCKRDDTECRDPKRVFPTLAYHLSKWHKGYRSAVLSVVRGENEPKLTQSLQWQFDLLFKEPLTSLEDMPPGPLVVVLDALDECGDSASFRSALAKFLRELARVTPQLKVFVTSRPQPEFDEVFNRDAVSCHTFNISTEVDDVQLQKDMSGYIKLCAEGIQGLSLTDEQILALTAKASGLFIWTSTVFNFLGKQFDKNTAIANILSSASVGSQEAELDQIYKTVIKNASGGSEENAQIIQNVLGLVACTAKNRPLSEDALVHFLSTEKKGFSLVVLKGVIDNLQAVLYRDGLKGQAICARHPSFLDFISDHKRSKEYQTEPAPLNTTMSVRCLQIMLSELKFNICGLESSYIPNDEVPYIQERVSECISQQLQYSCLYWMNHHAGSKLDADQHLKEDYFEKLLCQPRALYWLECLSLIKELNSAIDILALCAKYFKSSSQISDAANELFRLVSAYHTAISMSTPHLYVSALSWVLAESIVANSLYPSFHNQHLIKSGKEKNWRNTLWIANVGSPILCASYSPDGRHIVSGSGDDTLRIWDAHTGNPVGNPLTGHSDRVTSVAYSPDGGHIVSGSGDKTLRIWDAYTGHPVGNPLTGHSDWISSVAYSPDGRHIVSGSGDKTLRTWDAHTGHPVGDPLTGHSRQVTSVAYSPDGRHIVSGSYDRTLRIWDAHTGHPVGDPLTGHSDWVRYVAYSPDGRHIVSGSHDKTLRIWDAHTGHPVGGPLTGHSSWVSSVAYSPDGKHIVSGSHDKTLRIWDAHTGHPVGEPLRGHSHHVSSVAYSPDGKHIVSGSFDGTLRMWDAHTGYTKSVEMDGWVNDSSGRLLLWVPYEYREGLFAPYELYIPIDLSSSGYPLACVDWEKLAIHSGLSWANIIKNTTQS
ncbi:hypothetical protein M0805_002606 [Coniferiporia weirii]|nr:hypothetical protein M0805_002606 [Coniferiporia weirii]